eukprot:2171060-Rhodomonas_salina.1
METRRRVFLLGLVFALSLLSVSADCPAPFSVANVDGGLEQKILEIEDHTKTLANAIAAAFSGRCSKMENCVCAPYHCSDNIGDTVCSTHGGSTRPDWCSAAATCDGVQVNYDASVAYWAGEGEATQEQKELLCGTKEVDSTFKDIADKMDNGMLYLYFGAYNGVIKEYPGRVNECGGGFDPRIRPWYRAGSSGPKDVVVLIDISGSMDKRSGSKTRLQLGEALIQAWFCCPCHRRMSI